MINLIFMARLSRGWSSDRGLVWSNRVNTYYMYSTDTSIGMGGGG
jgi:hypothetical protein